MFCFKLQKAKSVGKFLHSLRKFSTYEEIKIPVPWGHVSGKWWGPQNKRPILALHGRQENAGTFDRLIPHLPPNTGVLAIDILGHGLSSHLYPGTFYHEVDLVVMMKRIIEFFKWPKVSLMGHSLGAILSYSYTMLYPDKVDFLICIEGLKPLAFEEEKLERMVRLIEGFMKYDALYVKSTEPPAYTKEELVTMLHEGSQKSIDLENCKYILNRNIRPSKDSPGKYYFGRDPRVKIQGLLGWSQKDLIDCVHRITCPILYCRGIQGQVFENMDHLLQFIEKLVECNNRFEICVIEGTHHVHLNNPKGVAKVIAPFIERYGRDCSGSGLDPALIVDKQNIFEV